MKYKLIGIAGKAQAGKDTCADYIMQHLMYEKASFADPLKTMLATGLGLTKEQLYGDQKEAIDERYHCSPRYLMQTLGTEWGRNKIGEDIWINAMRDFVCSNEGSYIIPDVRFEGEAKFIRENGILIHVEGGFRGNKNDQHVSERGINKIYSDSISNSDIIIKNTGTIKAYYDMIDEVIANKLY